MACALLPAASCSKDYKAQIDELQGEIDALNKNIASLETITANLGDFRDLLTIIEAGDPIVSAAPVQDGFEFTFTNNGKVTVHNQTAGISAGISDDGFYWSLKGSALQDGGKNVPIAKTPVFRVNGQDIEVSVDGKKSWTKVSDVNDPAIVKVEEAATFVRIVFPGDYILSVPKEAKMSVALSGDGSTMASTGKVVVDFLISGKSGDYTVTPLLPEGWDAKVTWENNEKGQIEFTAPSAGATDKARVFFCDGLGRMVTADIDFSTLTVDETFPVMYPAWDAYCVGFEGGEVEVLLYTNLDSYTVTVEDGCTWLKAGGTKAVREDKLPFVAEANEAVAMRSTLVSIVSGNYEQKVAIWQEGVLAFAGENLSANGTANCYIVSKEGDYYFDASVMGCGQSGIIPNVEFHSESAELFPESIAIWMNEDNVISDVRHNDNKIYFHATGVEGNAEISVKNSRGTVVWNWHIWCTDPPREMTHTNPDYLQFTVLDRNLGATSADPADGEATHGLYYQWGRKDPAYASTIVSSMYNNTSHAFAFAFRYPQRPFTEDGNTTGNWYAGKNDYLWGNPEYGKNMPLERVTKTIYDPCPLGYIVAPANTFTIFADPDRTNYTEAGIEVRTDYGQTDFYPWAGRTYKGRSTVGQELCFWHSCAARYGIYDDGGGCFTLVDKNTQTPSWFNGDMRARCMPVRCVKQVSE